MMIPHQTRSQHICHPPLIPCQSISTINSNLIWNLLICRVPVWHIYFQNNSTPIQKQFPLKMLNRHRKSHSLRQVTPSDHFIIDNSQHTFPALTPKPCRATLVKTSEYYDLTAFNEISENSTSAPLTPKTFLYKSNPLCSSSNRCRQKAGERFSEKPIFVRKNKSKSCRALNLHSLKQVKPLTNNDRRANNSQKEKQKQAGPRKGNSQALFLSAGLADEMQQYRRKIDTLQGKLQGEKKAHQRQKDMYNVKINLLKGQLRGPKKGLGHIYSYEQFVTEFGKDDDVIAEEEEQGSIVESVCWKDMLSTNYK